MVGWGINALVQMKNKPVSAVHKVTKQNQISISIRGSRAETNNWFLLSHE